jgi:hypothetical protein
MNLLTGLILAIVVYFVICCLFFFNGGSAIAILGTAAVVGAVFAILAYNSPQNPNP